MLVFVFVFRCATLIRFLKVAWCFRFLIDLFLLYKVVQLDIGIRVYALLNIYMGSWCFCCLLVVVDVLWIKKLHVVGICMPLLLLLVFVVELVVAVVEHG